MVAAAGALVCSGRCGYEVVKGMVVRRDSSLLRNECDDWVNECMSEVT